MAQIRHSIHYRREVYQPLSALEERFKAVNSELENEHHPVVRDELERERRRVWKEIHNRKHEVDASVPQIPAV